MSFHALTSITEQFSRYYTLVGSLLENYHLDSTPCGISQVKDVATLRLVLFSALDCARGIDAGQRQTVEGTKAVKFNMGAVKLKLDLCGRR